VERRREIGLRRVVGATRRQVVGWLVAEAASLGIAGSLLGLLAGTLAVAGLNAVAERLGAPVFLVTPRLALLASVLPAALAALAGVGAGAATGPATAAPAAMRAAGPRGVARGRGRDTGRRRQGGRAQLRGEVVGRRVERRERECRSDRGSGRCRGPHHLITG